MFKQLHYLRLNLPFQVLIYRPKDCLKKKRGGNFTFKRLIKFTRNISRFPSNWYIKIVKYSVGCHVTIRVMFWGFIIFLFYILSFIILFYFILFNFVSFHFNCIYYFRKQTNIHIYQLHIFKSSTLNLFFTWAIVRIN